jgi:hypothetical protein
LVNNVLASTFLVYANARPIKIFCTSDVPS